MANEPQGSAPLDVLSSASWALEANRLHSHSLGEGAKEVQGKGGGRTEGEWVCTPDPG